MSLLSYYYNYTQVGFGSLGDNDEFTTELMEWRLGTYDIITYTGDLNKPPGISGTPWGIPL